MYIAEIEENSTLDDAKELLKKIVVKKQQSLASIKTYLPSKPSIRDIIKYLNDPLLTHIVNKNNINYFVKYCSAWLNLDTTDIFSNTTGMPTYDDMLSNREYFVNNKSKDFRIVEMWPSMYNIKCVQEFGDSTFQPEDDLIFEYALKVLDGSKMPMPVLSYELHNGKTIFSQEGRHRASVAKMLNAQEIPVMVIAGLSSPGSIDVATKYQESIFKKFQN